MGRGGFPPSKTGSFSAYHTASAGRLVFLPCGISPLSHKMLMCLALLIRKSARAPRRAGAGWRVRAAALHPCAYRLPVDRA
jgi:hypothetical protein